MTKVNYSMRSIWMMPFPTIISTVRKIDTALDLSWLRRTCSALFNDRPAVDRSGADDPDAHRGHVIRSERLLCREVQVNLAYRWFCGLSIEDKLPDHSAFSRARNERFRDSDIFRQVFERVVAACIAAGLVGGEGFAVDASLIQADANKCRSIPGGEWSRDSIRKRPAAR